MSKEVLKIEINNEVEVSVQPDKKHEWLISTADVAEGYGLSASGLRSSKSRYSSELEEGKHFVIKLSQNATPSTYWTKKGVVRLGLLIKTPLAKQFRDWAEAPTQSSFSHFRHNLRRACRDLTSA